MLKAISALVLKGIHDALFYNLDGHL